MDCALRAAAARAAAIAASCASRAAISDCRFCSLISAICLPSVIACAMWLEMSEIDACESSLPGIG